MDDQRGITFGVQFGLDSSGLDTAAQKEREVAEEAGRAEAAVSQIGTTAVGVGAQASGAFSGAGSAGAQMGTTVRSSTDSACKSVKDLGTSARKDAGAGFDVAKSKANSFGAKVKSVFRGFRDAVRHPVQALKSTLAAALDKVRGNTEDAGAAAEEAGAQYQQMGQSGGVAMDTLGDKVMGLIKTMAGLAIAKKAASLVKDFLGAAIGAAASAEESQSKFDTVFGDQAGAAQTWINNFSGAAKRSKEEIKGFMADAQAMHKGLGMSEEAGAAMSKQVVALTYDLASFHNISDADAFAKIRSGLMGETEGLKSMGIVLNEATIQQAMLAAGFEGNESALRKQFGSLDEGAKAQLRYMAILDQSKDAQTDVTRTSDSYTNSLKGVKGMWQDFLAGAGARFTPILTRMFNSILDAWPRIEPALMSLVDVLGSGLEACMPIIMDLGETLLPIMTEELSGILSMLEPIMPIILEAVQTVLPPLLGIMSTLAETLLPPIVDALKILNDSVIQPLAPVIQTIAETILPPIASLLTYLSPLLEAIAPVLQWIGGILVWIADALATVVGWIKEAIDWLGDALGLSEKAQKESAAFMDWLNNGDGSAESLAQSIQAAGLNLADYSDMLTEAGVNLEDYGVTAEAAAQSIGSVGEAGDKLPETLPTVEVPDLTLNTVPAMQAMEGVGATSGEMYQTIAINNGNAWDAMASDAQAGADKIIDEFTRIRLAARDLGGVKITATVSGDGSVPHYAAGTRYHPGGRAVINDGGGGEMVVLPGGSQVIPADQTDKLITRSSGKTTVFAPQISITLGGKATEEDRAELQAWMDDYIARKYRELQDSDATDDALQEAL